MSDETIRSLARAAGDGDVDAARELLFHLQRSGGGAAPDLDRLKGLTASARKESQDKARAEKKRRRQELRADEILAQAGIRCDVEARAGRDHAIIMSIGSGDYDRPADHVHANLMPVVKPEWLAGTAKIVFEALARRGLRPTIEYWEAPSASVFDAGKGHNIVVHWDAAKEP